MNQSGTATWPAGQNCVGPHFAGKTVQTYWRLDLTRPLQVSSGIWHQVWFLSESDLFVQHLPQSKMRPQLSANIVLMVSCLRQLALACDQLFLGTLLKLLTWSSDPVITVWLLSNSPKSSHWCPLYLRIHERWGQNVHLWPKFVRCHNKEILAVFKLPCKWTEDSGRTPARRLHHCNFHTHYFCATLKHNMPNTPTYPHILFEISDFILFKIAYVTGIKTKQNKTYYCSGEYSQHEN